MSSDGPAIAFIPVDDSHRDLLLRWLSSDHARQWWGNPVEELALIYDGKGEHDPFIAMVGGVPIAYVQSWRPSQHPDLPWQHGMTDTTRGIDITIGEAHNLGKGLGSLIVKHFASRLFAEGATRLIIDPDISNDRAVAAYMKAGFTPYDTHVTDDGTDLLMELLPEDFTYAAGY
jgi:aminoglycoside 6'-N-acetyltransferase